jgi:hypothetical protein
MSTQLYKFEHGYAYGNIPEQIEFAKKTKDIGIQEVLNIFSDEIINNNFYKFIIQIDDYYNKNIKNNDIITINNYNK